MWFARNAGKQSARVQSEDSVKFTRFMTPLESFQLIHRAIQVNRKTKPLRVAINGIEGTGKTTFAEHLVDYFNSVGESALHVSIDGFHFNKERRYRQGRDSAIGYYEDSYDEKGFVEKVLLASQEEIPTITSATHDLETDEYLDLDPIQIPNNTILVTDGSYLFKPTYRNHWDLKIYLSTDFETALERGAKRDAQSLGGFDAAKEKFMQRYHASSKRYIQENTPKKIADIILNNTDFSNLIVEKSMYS